MRNALDEIIGKQFPVLDEGFVRVIDYMGDDAAVVQAARVSYGKGTKTVRDDERLIRYLMRHEHTSPFEMCELKLHLRVPMDTWRQWIRHRTASVNEYSTRYSVAINEMHRTSSTEWRLQSRKNKQGSDGYIEDSIGAHLSQREKELQDLARDVYNERLKYGVAREQARKDLPLSTYTEAYWKIDLKNLLHFLKLRMDEHAQYEIRQYANVIGQEIVARWVPITWKAFLELHFYALKLTQPEVDIIRYLNKGDVRGALRKAVEYNLLVKSDNRFKTTGEFRELIEKLQVLGFEWDLIEIIEAEGGLHM